MINMFRLELSLLASLREGMFVSSFLSPCSAACLWVLREAWDGVLRSGNLGGHWLRRLDLKRSCGTLSAAGFQPGSLREQLLLIAGASPLLSHLCQYCSHDEQTGGSERGTSS